jgi:hypothetical protein
MYGCCPVATDGQLILNQVSQRILNNSKTPKQCRSKWDREYSLYKDVVRRLKHTGGGDGDAESNADGEDNQAGDETGDTEDVSKKRTALTRAAANKQYKYSKSIMDGFEASELFRLMDEVYVLLLLVSRIN